MRASELDRHSRDIAPYRVVLSYLDCQSSAECYVTGAGVNGNGYEIGAFAFWNGRARTRLALPMGRSRTISVRPLWVSDDPDLHGVRTAVLSPS